MFGCLSWPNPSFCPSLLRRPCTLSALHRASRVCRCNRICLPGEGKNIYYMKPNTNMQCKFFFFFFRKHVKVLWLTGELRLPLAQALLLRHIEVRKIVVRLFQSLLLQTERSQSSGSISACKDSVRAIWKYTAMEINMVCSSCLFS